MSCCTKRPFLNTLISSIKKMYDANIYIARKNNRQVLFNDIWGKCKNLLSLSLSPFLFRKSNYLTMTYENTQNKKTRSADDRR